LKYAVFTVMLPDCTIEDTVKLLKSNGYDGVEWRFTTTDSSRRGEAPSFWGNNLSTVQSDASEQELKELKRSMDEAGLQTPNLASYIKCGDLAATENAMRAAVTLGSPSIRVGVPTYDRTQTYGELLAEARNYMHEVEALSKTYGIKGLVEVHFGNIASSASLARTLVEGFDPNHIGIIYDPGNMVHEGYEQYRMGLEVLGPYLAHVHVKNAVWKRTEQGGNSQELPHEPLWKAAWSAIPDGVVHWPQVAADLKAVGYDGWLSFEDFSGSADSQTLLRDNLAYIRSIL